MTSSTEGTPAAIPAAGGVPASLDARLMADPPGVENPYWQIVRQMPTSRLRFTGEPWSPESFAYHPETFKPTGPSRNDLVRRYSWAITDPASVSFVAEHANGGLVEIGAGTGYWAWQLSQRGVPVIPYDIAPPDLDENGWCQEKGPDGLELRPVFQTVLRGTAQDAALKRHPLFLCWPPMSSMAADALAAYRGDRVIYIGEGDWGCTANDDFHEALNADWEEIAEHVGVRWSGINDRITVYRRATSRASEPAPAAGALTASSGGAR